MARRKVSVYVCLAPVAASCVDPLLISLLFPESNFDRAFVHALSSICIVALGGKCSRLGFSFASTVYSVITAERSRQQLRRSGSPWMFHMSSCDTMQIGTISEIVLVRWSVWDACECRVLSL